MSKKLIYNGTIMTMNATNQIFKPGYVYLEHDVIVEVGAWSEDGRMDGLKAEAAYVYDAKGKVVIPGIINGHTHLFQTFMRGVSDHSPLAQWLKEIIWPMSLAMEPEDFYLAALIGCIENLKSGATYIMDHHYIHTYPENDASVLRAMVDSGIRGHLARGGSDLAGEVRLRETEEQIFGATDRLLDEWEGAASGRIRIALGPLNLYGCSRGYLERAAVFSRDRHLISHVHVAETSEQIDTTMARYGLRNLELLNEVGLLGEQTQVVHGVWLDDGELAMISDQGASVIHCPVSNMYLASGVARVPEMLSMGINVALGTDGPGSNNCQDNLEVLKFTACLHKVNELDATLLPPMDVLRMATVNGAKAVGRSDELGSLEPGKKADLVAVDMMKAHISPVHRASSALVYNANGNDVDLVIVGGNVVVDKGVCTWVDEQEILQRAQARVNVLRAKLAGKYPVFANNE
ncbi:amidohydrolase [Paenibacillus sp. CGMCC 1.16610]|uniref:Amidohydrolase family protein n=1 Tax=Paenibacillus anseongense TaxID=2682845 RepID=A0ABW9UD40_9BACL|nr:MULTISPECIES: amidohydrolase [Paenibacillus]MBA2944144.1 amidohydrolase [Paenibacillus sp. CGMCC 1.16610]MVQ38034.1 amidohydrolase family protein [Paenibacillus anseongense]